MAGIIPFGADIDLNKNQIKNARFDNLATASAPSSPAVGQMYYDTTVNCNMCWNGSVWIPQFMDIQTYHTIRQGGGTLIATNTAGTYLLTLGSSSAFTSGTANTIIPMAIYLKGTDFPTVNGKAPKFKLKCGLFVNHAAPTGNFTFGLYAISQPASSGGTGVRSHTIGSLVTGSATTTITTPSADSTTLVESSDFSFPAGGDGWYAVCIVTTAMVASNSFLELLADLQIHNP